MDFAFDFSAAGNVKSPTEPVATRVCDRCIQRRVKCDLARPTCSRCSEAGWPCVYSNVKRRPGPPKGSRKKSKTTVKSDTSPVPKKARTELPYLTPTSHDDAANQALLSPTLTERRPVKNIAEITPDQTSALLQNFFIYINPAVLLLRHDMFLLAWEKGLVSDELKLTMLAMSAKLVDKCGAWSDRELEDTIQFLFDDNMNDSINERLSLDDFRQACMLVYLSFYQYPGEKAWQRIGQLARKAYSFGLHHIDNRVTETPFLSQTWTDDELDEWRYVWWCIFTMDSCSNITAVTPYSIETESIGTAMPRTSLFWPAHIPLEPGPLITMPPETSELSKTTEDIMRQHSTTHLFSIKLVTTALLREAGNLWRLSSQNPSNRWTKRQMALVNDVLAVKAALPERYFDPARDALGPESELEHFGRLAFSMHLQMARMLVSVPTSPSDDEQTWLKSWSEDLELCKVIVEAATAWDTTVVCNIDPAVCFIVMTTLLLIHTHKVSGLHMTLDQNELERRLNASQTVLLRILEHFARTWRLPVLLIASFKKFTEIVKGPLTPSDIMHIMRQFQGPMHQKWLGYVAVSVHAEQQKTANELATFDPNMMMQDWGFSSWEDVANFTTLFGFGDLPGLGV